MFSKFEIFVVEIIISRITLDAWYGLYEIGYEEIDNPNQNVLVVVIIVFQNVLEVKKH